MSCCSECTNNHFGEKTASRDLDNYKRKGAKKSTKSLLNILGKLDLEGMHLLDIGAGIGVVSNELRQCGLAEITINDISTAYLNIFNKEFGSQLKGIKLNCLQGDFLDVSENVDNVDIISLDKSICCYPDYRELVQVSASKANKWYAYVIPRDTWWVKIVHYFSTNLKFSKSDTFKSFIHPVADIEQIVLDCGFSNYTRIYQREWLIAVFRK